MARIVEVATARLSRRLHTPFVTALRRTEFVVSVAVRVTDADGRTGFGEGPQVWRVTGESLESIEACVLGPLADALLGWDPESEPLPYTHSALAHAVVGNGGHKPREITQCPAMWAACSGTNSAGGATAGWLRRDASGTALTGRLVSTSGPLTDSWTITR